MSPRRVAPDPALFGPNGELISATLANTVSRLSLGQVLRLAERQTALRDNPGYKDAHWKVFATHRSVRPFAASVYYARLWTSNRLRLLMLDLASPEAEAAIEAVIGRIICLYGAPDLDSDQARHLGQAWLAVIG